MGTDNLYHKRSADKINRKRKPKTGGKISWLIVCEGEKTEPNYFKGVEAFFKNELAEEFKINFVVEGEGKNTLSLVNSVDNYLEKV